MIPTKVSRGFAIAAVFSFLLPPMLVVTILAGGVAFYNDYRYPLANWLLVGLFAFALLTCFWVPSNNRLRLVITVINALLISGCLIVDIGMLMGVLTVKT
jgi:hypothetical protein